MGAWAGKRQRPCANMDNARSLDQSCVNHEFIENKPLETRGAGVVSRIFAKTRQAPGRNCHQERRAICSSGRITSKPEFKNGLIGRQNAARILGF
jgi:hypothetical protein